MSEQSANFAFTARTADSSARTRLDVATERRSLAQSLMHLIGRTAWFAAALLVGSGLACVFGDASFGLATLAWLTLIAIGAFLLVGASFRASRAPARQATITAYTRGFTGTLVYAGATWGAGGFLAGLNDNILVLLIFSTAMILAAVALLRDHMPVLCFALPALGLATAGAVAESGIMGGLLVAACGACILAAAEIAARLSDEPRDTTLTLS